MVHKKSLRNFPKNKKKIIFKQEQHNLTQNDQIIIFFKLRYFNYVIVEWHINYNVYFILN